MDEVGRITAETQRALERLWRRRDRRGRSIWGQILAILQQLYDPSTGGVHVPALPDLAGDVTGRPNANTAVKLQGIAVSTTDPTTGQVLAYNGTAWAPASSSGGHTVADEGAALTARTTLNFVGDDVVVTDDAANDQTDVTITGAIRKALVDAKGDLIAATAADAVTRLAVGTDGYVLTADAAEATGLKWAASAGGASTRWELVVDQEAGELIWAGSAGSFDLIYAEVP